MIVSVASGKGGTGKTTVAVNLALTASRREEVHLLDCDVEEPNAYIFIQPEFSQKKDVKVPVPEIDETACTYCGTCARICEYNALAVVKDSVLVFPELCHGCGGCRLLCPEQAIRETGRSIGVMESGRRDRLHFTHGRLNIGEAISPPLIREVKKNIISGRLNILDAPPGTSCPVIETLRGSDFCILVTEPTPFGLHDLKLAVETVSLLNIPAGVVLNRSGKDECGVVDFCRSRNLPVMMTIPLDKKIAETYSRGDILIDVLPGLKQSFMNLYRRLDSMLAGISPREERI
ncbi:MAG: ATP-binding protein [Candidatus Aminicenantaceae bacterium]